jgi:hypothetical protein
LANHRALSMKRLLFVLLHSTNGRPPPSRARAKPLRYMGGFVNEQSKTAPVMWLEPTSAKKYIPSHRNRFCSMRTGNCIGRFIVVYAHCRDIRPQHISQPGLDINCKRAPLADGGRILERFC